MLSTTGSLASTLGVDNPFRYKGYYYDFETGLYYCNSRYYNPDWGRWLSADSVDYLDSESINGLNLYAYCGNNPIIRIDPYGNAWYHWVVGGIVAVVIVAVAIGTAGAIVAAAPAIAGYLGTAAIAYTGSSALAGVVATAVSVGAAALAVSTIAVGVNEAGNVLTGTNVGRNLLGDSVYDALGTVTLLGGAMYISGGMTLPYPSTGRVEPNNLKEQIVIDGAMNNPNKGQVIVSSLGDRRMPGWLGWQKYSYSSGGIDVHYVGNRFFSKWYSFQPWFDFKFK